MLQLPGGDRSHATNITAIGRERQGVFLVEFTNQYVNKKAAIIRRKPESPARAYVVTLEVDKPKSVSYGCTCVLNTGAISSAIIY